MANLIQVKRGLKSNLPVLSEGEFAFTTDTNETFIGDGTTNYQLQSYNDFNANTILAADSANSPSPLTIEESTLVGRTSGGNIDALSGSTIMDMLSGTATSSFSANSQKITSLSAPSSGSDAVNKTYVDDISSKGLIAHERVLDKDELDPSTLTPSEGDRYWIAGTGVGTWSGHDYEIATYDGSSWSYEPVTDGDFAFVDDDGVFYFYDDGSSSLKQLNTAIGDHASTHENGGVDELISDTETSAGTKGISSGWAYTHANASNPHNLSIAYENPIAADAFSSSEVQNLRSGALDDGTTPWTSNNHYDDADAQAAINADTDHGSTASHNYFSGDYTDLSNTPSIAYNSTIPADAFSSSQVTNLRNNELADGSTPWTANNNYTNSDAISAINGDTDHGSTASHNYFSGNYGDLSNTPSIAYNSPIAADAFTSTEVTNLKAGKLDDGTTPWSDSITYNSLSGGTGINYNDSTGEISVMSTVLLDTETINGGTF